MAKTTSCLPYFDFLNGSYTRYLSANDTPCRAWLRSKREAYVLARDRTGNSQDDCYRNYDRHCVL